MGHRVSRSSGALNVERGRGQRGVLLAERVFRVEVQDSLNGARAPFLVALECFPPWLAVDVVDRLFGVYTSEEDGANGSISGLEQERHGR